VAKLLGVSPLLGLTCGSVALVGGHGTSLGFAPEFAKAGLEGAAVLGAAAATYGIIAGALLGGPIGGALIRRYKLQPPETAVHLQAGASHAPGFISDLRALRGFGPALISHLLLVLLCVKGGAWVSFFFQSLGATFPVYMGAMLLAVLARNFIDFRSAWVRTEVVDTIGSVALGWFLSMAMMNLDLAELANAAGPMLVILTAQTVMAAAFACFLTFRLMGRDYEAAVMAGGQLGFGLGATANAIASMKSLVESFGPAPRAFLVVPIVGSFLVDLFNAFNITAFLNLVR
jgi:ESS family glutamate:Na+ symporter